MITKGIKELCAEAEAEIETIPAAEAVKLMKDENVQLVDIRDVRELWREGAIPGALHAPRGMLEFWVDPDSPYHKPIFRTDKKLVLFCASGLRSVLPARTLQDMGMDNVLGMEGGFTEWKMQDLPVDYLT